VKIAFANETNVANINSCITSPWVRIPEGVAISRILDRKLFTVDIVLHRGLVKEDRNGEKMTGAPICQLQSVHRIIDKA